MNALDRTGSGPATGAHTTRGGTAEPDSADSAEPRVTFSVAQERFLLCSCHLRCHPLFSAWWRYSPDTQKPRISRAFVSGPGRTRTFDLRIMRVTTRGHLAFPSGSQLRSVPLKVGSWTHA
jgi:hypothetical protein